MGELVVEFTDVSMESNGCLNAGRIKFSDQNVIFKNSKTGRLDQCAVSEIDSCSWIRLASRPGIRLFLRNGAIYRFGGFSDADYEKLKVFIKRNWNMDLGMQETSVRGWNYGVGKFEGSVLTFDVENQNCFEIPLKNVSNCTSGKNEVALEFYQNDEASVSLMEVRFHIPNTDDPDTDPVEEFYENVMKSAGVIRTTGDALAILSEINCTTPRGRYEIKIFPTFLNLRGKTSDYKIPISSILRLFLLPHKDGRRMFFVISLDPPIKYGQTRYPFLIAEFNKEDDIELELGLTDDVIQEKYQGKLTKHMKGPLYEVVSRIMKTLVNRKITVPGTFVGHSGTPALSCAHKSASGFLYPLERGFMFVHKPPIHIRFEEIACVNFARSDVSTRSFDFEVETKQGPGFTFNSIEKEEYGKLYDFVTNKRLRIKNVGKATAAANAMPYKEGWDSDEEDDSQHDPYKARLEREVQEREDEEEDDDESGSSEDSDYRPDAAKREEGSDASEPDEEFDSDAKGSSSGSEEGGSDDETQKKVSKKPPAKSKEKESAANLPSAAEKKRKHESSSEEERVSPAVAASASTKPKPKKQAKVSEKESGEKGGRKRKAEKDPNAPKHFATAYMIWLNENREKLKEPGMSVTEVAKKAGQVWKSMSDNDKSKWNKLAQEDRARYDREVDEYKKKGGVVSSTSKQGSSRTSPVKAAAKPKSKEHVSSSSGDSSDDNAALAAKKTKGQQNVKKEKNKEPTPESSSSSEIQSSDSD